MKVLELMGVLVVSIDFLVAFNRTMKVLELGMLFYRGRKEPAFNRTMKVLEHGFGSHTFRSCKCFQSHHEGVGTSSRF